MLERSTDIGYRMVVRNSLVPWILAGALLVAPVLAPVLAADSPSNPAGSSSSASGKQTPRSSKAQAGKPAAPGKGEKVNINTATEEELELLPGIGPSVARRILDYRKENGAFKKVEELMNVRGIGEKSFQKLKDLITVES